MRKATFLQKMLCLFCALCFITSCQDQMDEHYEVPDWVADNAWEVLSSGEHGNFSIFLKGIEIADFKQMLEGKSILTIMAPDDASFQTYLEGKGYASIDEMPVSELKKLIGYHVLYYSYNKENFVNFRPLGSTETDEQKNIGAGTFYKHRTKSADVPSLETNADGSSVMVYHLERFLPVFSYRYFQTNKIDAKANYEAFFPNSTWTGDNGFNVANASVKEYAIIANNGYIYTVDRVIEPLETIYTELKKRDNYSIFFDLYDSFGSYVADNNLTKSYAAAYGVDTLYQYQHVGLPNIACEWPTTSSLNFEALSATSYTIFAPSNTAVNNFFDKFWKIGGYASLNEVDILAQNSFLRQFIYGGSMVFPEQIGKTGENELTSLEGSVINIQPSMLNEKIMCVNGALYGMNQIQSPSSFASVAGSVFQYKDARSFLYAMSGSGSFSTYTSEDAKFIMLIPTATQFEGSEIRTSYSTQTLEQSTEDGWVELSPSAQQNIMYMHSANISGNQQTILPENGTKVIPTLASWNYWFVKDGEITCSALFNEQLNPEFNGKMFSPFTKIGDASNGSDYWFNGEKLFTTASYGLQRSLAICEDKNYVYYNFVQLAKKANLVSGESLMNLIGKGRFIGFIPTNDAIQKALKEGRIPGARNAAFDASGSLTGEFDDTVLKNYLSSYFITANKNTITDYPYIGSKFKSGKYWSERMAVGEETLAPQLNYTDNGSNLSIQLEGFRKCNVVSTYYQFPFAFTDGCFHLIDDVF